MCDGSEALYRPGGRIVPLEEAVGLCLEHDITEIRQDEFKGRAFKRGHRVCQMDIERLKDLGKNNLFVLSLAYDEMHEDDAALALANALKGSGVAIQGEPSEGKLNIVAEMDGLLKVNKEALLSVNMLGDVMCATLHDNTVVKTGQVVAGTRAIPLTVKKSVVEEAVRVAESSRMSSSGVIEVIEVRKPRAGIVITGNEVYYGRVKDAFSTVIGGKIEALGGSVVGVHYAPDDQVVIEERLRDLLDAGADLLVVTGGMSVDPDDVTRFAIGRLGAVDITYGSASLPGAMVLTAYIDKETIVPIIGIPACGMYHRTTVFDLLVPRLLAGERIGRRELAEMGHGGLCLGCDVCRYPVCPFGK